MLRVIFILAEFFWCIQGGFAVLLQERSIDGYKIADWSIKGPDSDQETEYLTNLTFWTGKQMPGMPGKLGRVLLGQGDEDVAFGDPPKYLRVVGASHVFRAGDVSLQMDSAERKIVSIWTLDMVKNNVFGACLVRDDESDSYSLKYPCCPPAEECEWCEGKNTPQGKCYFL
tara:strand:- start:2558 stop:3070 length:513 start_codon:yes stop_codon:yes gene_type:complete